jgi:hypothetical protein
VNPNTDTRVGRMMEGLLKSENKQARVVVTVQVEAGDGAKKLHDTFAIRKHRDTLYVSIPDTAQWDAEPRVLPVSPVSMNLRTGEVRFDETDARSTDLNRYAANAALRFALTGRAPTPANGKVHVVEEAFCGACGNKLKDPESIRLGIGPDCEEKITGHKRKKQSRRITPRAAKKMGQTSLGE